jgi:DNA-3-methyladenine glycosylase I
MTKHRCAWASAITDEEYLEYHDSEWSEPITSDRDMFELLCLEGAQAGLSWQTVLKKRKGYRAAFHNFDIESVIKLTTSKLESIIQTANVIKQKGKIHVCQFILSSISFGSLW